MTEEGQAFLPRAGVYAGTDSSHLEGQRGVGQEEGPPECP